MNQVSEFTIGKLNTILEQIQKDLGFMLLVVVYMGNECIWY